MLSHLPRSLTSIAHRLRIVGLALFVSVGLTACAEQPTDEGLEGDTLGATGDTLMARSAAVADTVEVGLVNYAFEMPEELPAGPTVFSITNESSEEEHNFEVEGQGIERALDTPLQPGATATLRVDLEPGEYTIYCPVADHRDQGMEMTLTVTEAPNAEGGITDTL